LKKIIYLSVVILIIAITFVEIKFSLINKVKIVGGDQPIFSFSENSAFYNLYQIVRKEGIIDTIFIVKNKFTQDIRLAGLGYSLRDKDRYPKIESVDKRESLPLKKIINKALIYELSTSITKDSISKNWHRSNGNNSSTKYSSLKQINRDNVKNLEIAWKYQSLEKPKSVLNVETNPIIVGDKMFVPTVDNHLLSINAKTGIEIWKIKLPFMVARRGLVWEPNDDFSKSRLFVPTSKGVYAINAENGQILNDFGNGGQIGNQLSLI